MEIRSQTGAGTPHEAFICRERHVATSPQRRRLFQGPDRGFPSAARLRLLGLNDSDTGYVIAETALGATQETQEKVFEIPQHRTGSGFQAGVQRQDRPRIEACGAGLRKTNSADREARR